MRQTLDCVLFQLTPTKGPLERLSDETRGLQTVGNVG